MAWFERIPYNIPDDTLGFTISRKEYNRIVHEEGLGEDEAEPQLLEEHEEKEPLTLREKRTYVRTRMRNERDNYNMCMSFLLMFITVGMFTYHIFSVSACQERENQRLASFRQIPVDYKDVTFERQEVFSNRSHPMADMAWATMMPASRRCNCSVRTRMLTDGRTVMGLLWCRMQRNWVWSLVKRARRVPCTT